MNAFKILNVQDFGALGDEVNNDGPAIQAALDNAATIAAAPGSKLKGAIVFFPPGVYKISGTIGLVIPRIAYGSLVIRGSGMWATQISASDNTFPSDVPVVDFAHVPGKPTGYEISDLLITRATRGIALRHVSSGDNQRLVNSTLRNLKLFSPIKEEIMKDGRVVIVESKYNTLEITGGLSSTFENLLVGGGETAMVLQNSSHCILTNIHQGVRDTQGSHNALRIIGGGSHKLSDIRSENVDGTTLTLEECSSVVIDNVFDEGKLTRYVLEVYGNPTTPSQDIVISHLGLATPCQSPEKCERYDIGVGPGAWLPRYGLRVNSYARNIRVLSGTIKGWGMSQGNPILIEGGAQHVSIENMHFFGNVGEYPLDNGPTALLNVDPSATNVQVSNIDGNSANNPTKIYKKWERSFGAVGV